MADALIFKDAETVMALPEVAAAYTSNLKKIIFHKSRMSSIGEAVEVLKRLHEILVNFETYRNQSMI